jgi:hypothetical protein
LGIVRLVSFDLNSDAPRKVHKSKKLKRLEPWDIPISQTYSGPQDD